MQNMNYNPETRGEEKKQHYIDGIQFSKHTHIQIYRITRFSFNAIEYNMKGDMRWINKRTEHYRIIKIICMRKTHKRINKPRVWSKQQQNCQNGSWKIKISDFVVDWVHFIIFGDRGLICKCDLWSALNLQSKVVDDEIFISSFWFVYVCVCVYCRHTY